MPAWHRLLPPTRGRLPSGEPIHRTDPGGSFDTDIVVLGVYPAARVAAVNVAGRRMNLPVQVERTSFELGVSASAIHLDDNYLAPLGLQRDQVLLMDLMPYFLSNTRKTKGRSMSGNIAAYEQLTGTTLGIEPRPSPAALVKQARTMPGNVARLTDYLSRCRPRLLLTLGSETAAFVRGESYGAVNRRAKQLFYGQPEKLSLLGVEVDVVHLAHPGLLMSGQGRAAGWVQRHEAWCAGLGREVLGDYRC